MADFESIHKLLDYDAARSKVRKLVDKPAEDTAKLPRVSMTRCEYIYPSRSLRYQQ
jgi:hypothetical protein